MAQMQKKTQEREAEAQEVEDLPKVKEADHSISDALLEEIDSLLAEEERRLYKEKLRSISFSGRRALDPCSDTFKVPEYMTETFLRAGFQEAKGGCCEDCG